ESLIAGSASAALGAIEQVRKESKGRVAIHLAAEGRDVPHSSAPVELLEELGFQVIGTLSERVSIRQTIPASLREAAAALIDRVCIVQSMERLERLLNENRLGDLAGWSLVSLDGSAFHATDGYLSGGSLE